MRLVAPSSLALMLSLAAASTSAAALPPAKPPLAAPDERFHLDLEAGRVFDRFQSAEADSLGISTSSAGAYGVRYDFRVLDIPAGKMTPRPALHLVGGMLMSERTLGAIPPGGVTERAPVLAIESGVRFVVPLEVLPGNSGVAFRLGYDGGYVLSRNGDGDFLTQSAIVGGFERTSGAFEGSALELGRGRNETFGRAAAANRWSARFLLQGRIGAPHTPDGRVAEDEHGLRGFLRLEVDTDGKQGPDGLSFQMGLALDAATMFRRAAGMFGL